jgi:type I restriction enzyme R subunit
MLEKYEVCRGLFHGFDWSALDDRHAAGAAGLLPAAQEHILAQENGKARCCGA